ncbi:unnamed protein product [Closterium sp. NIES-64]|nr:unnamed protein product [Closterium sp. NIES-64]
MHNEIFISGSLVGGGLELGLKERIARRGRERRGLAGVVGFGGGEGMGAAEDYVKDALGGDPCVIEDSADVADKRMPLNRRFVSCKLQFVNGGSIDRRREGGEGGHGVSHEGRLRVDPQWSRKRAGGGSWRGCCGVGRGDGHHGGGDEAAEGSGAGNGGWQGRGERRRGGGDEAAERRKVASAGEAAADAGAEAATRPRRGAARAAAASEAAVTRARRRLRGRGGGNGAVDGGWRGRGDGRRGGGYEATERCEVAAAYEATASADAEVATRP